MCQASKNVVGSSRGRQDLVHSGFGDESKLEDELVNPLFDIDLYRNYSERTRTNLVHIFFSSLSCMESFLQSCKY